MLPLLGGRNRGQDHGTKDHALDDIYPNRDHKSAENDSNNSLLISFGILIPFTLSKLM